MALSFEGGKIPAIILFMEVSFFYNPQQPCQDSLMRGFFRP